jgi:hypothetical protein
LFERENKDGNRREKNIELLAVTKYYLSQEEYP